MAVKLSDRTISELEVSQSAWYATVMDVRRNTCQNEFSPKWITTATDILPSVNKVDGVRGGRGGGLGVAWGAVGGGEGGGRR